MDDEDAEFRPKKLQVLVSASDRLKETDFKGVFSQQKHQRDKRQKRVRVGKNHLKFALYHDDEIGFTA